MSDEVDLQDLADRVEKLEYDQIAVSDVEKWNRTAWFIEQLLMENSVLRAAIQKAGIAIDETASERAEEMKKRYVKLHAPAGSVSAVPSQA